MQSGPGREALPRATGTWLTAWELNAPQKIKNTQPLGMTSETLPTVPQAGGTGCFCLRTMIQAGGPLSREAKKGSFLQELGGTAMSLRGRTVCERHKLPVSLINLEMPVNYNETLLTWGCLFVCC